MAAPASQPELFTTEETQDLQDLLEDLETLDGLAAIARFNSWICRPGEDIRRASWRFFAFMWMTRRELLPHSTLARIAFDLGITKGCMSSMVRSINRETGVRARGQKRASASEIYRALRLGKPGPRLGKGSRQLARAESEKRQLALPATSSSHDHEN